MARKPRDYKAEERRRNELARERGFTTRAAERGAKNRRDYEKAGYSTHSEYASARAKARAWSRKHSAKPVTKFRATFTPQLTNEYNLAFTERKQKTSHENYIDDLATYLHDIDPEHYPDKDDPFWLDY